jgi:hypothetical protein
VILRVEDLRGEARDAYRMWHDFFGLSEASALDLVRADGLVEESGVDGLAGSLGNIFGLSEAAARVASRGRGSVSEVAGRSASPLKPGDNDRLISLIEQWASDIRFRGETLLIYNGESREQASRRAAYYKVLAAAQNDFQRLWIVNVVNSWRPELVDSASSRSLNETTRKPGSGGRQGGTVHG